MPERYMARVESAQRRNSLTKPLSSIAREHMMNEMSEPAASEPNEADVEGDVDTVIAACGGERTSRDPGAHHRERVSEWGGPTAAGEPVGRGCERPAQSG